MIIASDLWPDGVPPQPPCCPRCAGPLRRWGHARPRRLRRLDGSRLMLRPRRLRCPACQVTHVVLPAVASAPRRADTVDVIGAALLAHARGQGHRSIAAELGRPPGTVRGWIRRATDFAETIRGRAIQITAQLGPDAHPRSPTRPADSPLGDAIEALGSATAAVIRRLGPVPQPWHLAAMISGGLLPPPRHARSG